MNDKTEADIIILGVGTCGEDLSLRLLAESVKVIGIESNLIGGECPYWACIPSKVIVQAANAVRTTRHAAQMTGISKVKPDWAPVATRLRYITGGWHDGVAVERYHQRGGTMIKGRGRLTDPRTVAVGNREFKARRGIVIAIGSKPFIPPIPGIDDIDFWTTHEIMQMEELPNSMIILGGGNAGCELAQAMARFGIDVTIVEAGDRLLPREEPEVSETIATSFRDEGIHLHLGTRAKYVERRGNSVVITLIGGAQIIAEQLLVAAGRIVDLSDLGLETAGLDPTARNIAVDDRMRAADGIWAMGDVTGKSPLTHVAEYQSAVIAAQILNRKHPPARYDAVPRGIYTDPEVGAVGMTEAQASDAGIDMAIAIKQLPLTFRGIIDGVDRGFIKLIADRNTGLLVGATVVGPRGTDMLGLLNLAVHARISVTELKTMIYAFPSYYGTIGEALGVRHGLTTVLDPDYRGVETLDFSKT
jgi:pyruvate/2-oxoglutarate dehydrogenase complex dihydrolipoamide dehydrogenase (E3) component